MVQNINDGTDEIVYELEVEFNFTDHGKTDF